MPGRCTPADPLAWCRPLPGSGGGGGSGGWTWAAKLQLEDATGRLDALLLGEAGSQLLGLGPCDLKGSAAAAAQLGHVVSRLGFIAPGGVGRSGEGAAWLEVVLTACPSTGAAAAADEAELAAAEALGSSGGGMSDGAGAALAAPGCCVYLLHDTHLALT